MTACIFAGPTLLPRDNVTGLQATWLPPAKQGDVHRAVSLLRPRAIGLIDGYFQSVPSVWHKEILWALHQGVYVFGAASMGALRAAELAPFGMQGVGRIFEAYRSRVLAPYLGEPFEDDDEVAVIHGPAESGYLAASEAMVNIRCTLAAAERAGVLSTSLRDRLVEIAKRLFFPDRTYDALLERAREAGVANAELEALAAWLPSGRINQKRLDALALLEAMRSFLDQDPAPAQPRFAFEHTIFWERAIAGASRASLHDADETRVLDELRVDAVRWRTLERQVMCALIAEDSADSLGASLNEQHETPEKLERLLEEAARADALRRLREDVPPEMIERQMLAQTRLSGEFDMLRVRAREKEAELTARRDLPTVEEFPGWKLLELADWYFGRVLEQDMPEDLEQWVRSLGYADLPRFYRAIFEEYVYRQSIDGSAPAQGGPGTAAGETQT
jgi:hypothetical protein